MSGSKGRRWLITGVSSGIGFELMKAALALGDSVVGTYRNPERKAEIEALAPGRAKTLALDLTDATRVGPTVENAARLLGGLDIVVNNAGSGIFGPAEACSDADFEAAMETNFFGLVRVTRAALPHLRASHGTLVNMSSMAGIISNPGTTPYTAAKHAVQGLSESLAAELAPLGVRVISVLPGGFRTNFFSANTVLIRDDFAGLYSSYPAGQIRQSLRAHIGHELGDPAKLASAVIAAINSDHPPTSLVLGGDALQYVGAKLDGVQADLDHWRDVSLQTNFSPD